MFCASSVSRRDECSIEIDRFPYAYVLRSYEMLYVTSTIFVFQRIAESAAKEERWKKVFTYAIPKNKRPATHISVLHRVLFSLSVFFN